MKILCLIIDAVPRRAWRETYAVHRKVWNQFLDRFEIEGYFLHADPTLTRDYVVEGRRFTARGDESYTTILHKTLKAIEVLHTGHDYVIRTNISSLYDFGLLRRRALPSEGFYAGHVWPKGPFVSGVGMILSRDVAQKLLAPPTELVLRPKDDVAIGQILKVRGVVAREEPWFCYDYSKDTKQVVIGKHLHYRLRDETDPRRVRERSVTEHVGALILAAAR